MLLLQRLLLAPLVVHQVGVFSPLGAPQSHIGVAPVDVVRGGLCVRDARVDWLLVGGGGTIRCNVVYYFLIFYCLRCLPD